MMFKPEKIEGYSDELKALSKEHFTIWFNYRRANKKIISPMAWSLANTYKIPLTGPEADKAIRPYLNVCRCDSRDLAFFGHKKECDYKKSLGTL